MTEKAEIPPELLNDHREIQPCMHTIFVNGNYSQNSEFT